MSLTAVKCIALPELPPSGVVKSIIPFKIRSCSPAVVDKLDFNLNDALELDSKLKGAVTVSLSSLII